MTQPDPPPDPAAGWHAVAPPARRRASTRWWAALCSALVPGTGQVIRRRWGRASVLLALSAGVAVVGVWAATRPRAELVALVLDPAVLTGLVVTNGVLFVARAVATADALHDPHRPRDGSLWRRIGATLGAVVLAVLLVAPHAAAGWTLHRTQAVLEEVFVADRSASSTSPLATLLRGGLERVIVPEPIERPIAPPVAAPGGPGDTSGDAEDGSDGPLRAPQPDPSPLDDPTGPPDPPTGDSPTVEPWIPGGRLTVAVLGSDRAPGRFSARTDAMLVVSIDTETGDAAILSVDRYLRDFPVPSRFATPYEERCATGGSWNFLNALYTCAAARAPEQFARLYPESPDPAAAAVTETLALLLGIEIHHHALVDMAGFVGVVDGLGGVDVDVAERIVVRISPPDGVSEWRTHDIPAGRQRLDGEQALAYVRMRDPGDAGRMRRQRCLVSSLVRNTDLASVVRGLPEITRAIEEHVVTDIPIGALPDLVQVLARVEDDRLVGVGLGPPTYRGADHVPNLPAIRARVAQVLEDPLAAVESGRTIETGTEVCG